jgi:hypothetical protein
MSINVSWNALHSQRTLPDCEIRSIEALTYCHVWQFLTNIGPLRNLYELRNDIAQLIRHASSHCKSNLNGIVQAAASEALYCAVYLSLREIWRHPMSSAAAMPETKDPAQRSVPTGTLDALNFFLADVRDGLGPYLAIYLLVVRGPSHGWNEATVGLVLTIAGIVGLLSQTPAGGLIDRAKNKPRIVIAGALLVTLSSLSLPIVSGFTMVTITQSIAAAAGAIFAPAISAITLGQCRVGSACRRSCLVVRTGRRLLADGGANGRQRHRRGAAEERRHR